MQIKVKKFPVFDNVHQELNQVYIDELLAGSFWKPSLPGQKRYLVSSVKKKEQRLLVSSRRKMPLNCQSSIRD